jgi:hypothetical protein
MTTSTLSLFTRPGVTSAKNRRRVGAPNTQLSGETPMVGTIPPADDSATTLIRTRLDGQTHRFVTVDHRDRCLRINLAALAEVIAEIVTEDTAALTGELTETRAEVDRLHAEKVELGAGLIARDQEIIALTADLEQADMRLSELRGEGGVA